MPLSLDNLTSYIWYYSISLINILNQILIIMITILIHIVTINVIIIVSLLCHFQIIKILQLLKLDLFSSKLAYIWCMKNQKWKKMFCSGMNYKLFSCKFTFVENSE